MLPHFLSKYNLFNRRGLYFSWLFLLFLYTNGSQERTDTYSGCSQVVYLVNFQAGVDLATVGEDFVYLVCGYCIQTAAKGV